MNKLNFKNQSIEKTYFLFFILYNVSYLLFGTSSLQSVVSIGSIAQSINMIVCVAFFGIFFLTPQKISQWVWKLVALGIGAAVYISSKESSYFIFTLALVAYPKIENSNFFKNDLFYRTTAVVIIFLAGVFSLIPSVIGTRSFGVDNIVRNSFGFVHPNILGAVVVSLVSEFILWRRDNMTKLEILIVIFISFILNKYVNSRSAVITIWFILIVLTLYKIPIFKKNLEKVITKKWIMCIYLLMFGLSMIAIFKYMPGTGGSAWDQLNKLLSGRIGIVKDYFDSTSISLLPQTLAMYGSTNTVVLDNTYMYLLLRFGLLATLMFLLVTIFKGKNLIDLKDVYGIIVFIAFSIFGLMESTAFYPGLNMFLIIQMNKKMEDFSVET